MSQINYNDNHADMHEGEIVVGNFKPTFAEVLAGTYPKGRVGQIARNQKGERVYDKVPVFVPFIEYVKRDGAKRPQAKDFEGSTVQPKPEPKKAEPLPILVDRPAPVLKVVAVPETFQQTVTPTIQRQTKPEIKKVEGQIFIQIRRDRNIRLYSIKDGPKQGTYLLSEGKYEVLVEYDPTSSECWWLIKGESSGHLKVGLPEKAWREFNDPSYEEDYVTITEPDSQAAA